MAAINNKRSNEDIVKEDAVVVKKTKPYVTDWMTVDCVPFPIRILLANGLLWEMDTKTLILFMRTCKTIYEKVMTLPSLWDVHLVGAWNSVDITVDRWDRKWCLDYPYDSTYTRFIQWGRDTRFVRINIFLTGKQGTRLMGYDNTMYFGVKFMEGILFSGLPILFFWLFFLWFYIRAFQNTDQHASRLLYNSLFYR